MQHLIRYLYKIMKVCQYLSNAHPFYLGMVTNSIIMLRKYNKDVKVRLFLVQDEGKSTHTTNHRGNELSTKSKISTTDYIYLLKNNLNVEVLEKEPLKIEKGFFHIHRSLMRDTQEESLLFIDADTFIFKDVEELFDKYKEYDYVGLPISYLNGWNKEWLPFKPFNSAVNLWNNGWIRKFAQDLEYWCKLIKEKKHIVSDWCYQQCSRGTNREEMSTSLFVAENKLKHCVWDRWDVRNSATSIDYREAPNTYIFHTFTHNWERAKGLYLGERVKIKPCFIKV